VAVNGSGTFTAPGQPLDQVGEIIMPDSTNYCMAFKGTFSQFKMEITDDYSFVNNDPSIYYSFEPSYLSDCDEVGDSKQTVEWPETGAQPGQCYGSVENDKAMHQLFGDAPCLQDGSSKTDPSKFPGMGDVQWYGFAILVPPTFQAENSTTPKYYWQLVFQVWQGQCCSPPIWLQFQDTPDKLYAYILNDDVGRSQSDGVLLGTIPITMGEWNYIVVGTSVNQDNSWIQIYSVTPGVTGSWLENPVVTNIINEPSINIGYNTSVDTNGVPPDAVFTPMFGIYRYKIPFYQQLYFGQYNYGKTLDSVLPQ